MFQKGSDHVYHVYPFFCPLRGHLRPLPWLHAVEDVWGEHLRKNNNNQNTTIIIKTDWIPIKPIWKIYGIQYTNHFREEFPKISQRLFLLNFPFKFRTRISTQLFESTTHRGQIGRVHLVPSHPFTPLVLLIFAVRRHHVEEVQKCPKSLAVRRWQQLDEMLKCLLLKSPVPDLCWERADYFQCARR